MEWSGVEWGGVGWCGVVWCGVVWCGVVWWWWCRRSVQRACLFLRANARASNSKWASASAPAPSAGLTSPTPLRLFPPKGRFQASPVQTSPNPVSWKKIARSAHLTPLSIGGRGAQSFPSPQRWMPWIRNDMRRCTWTSLPG